MFVLILKLFLISLIPIGGTILLKLLDKFAFKEKFNKVAKYILFGIIFGIFSILGSYLGVEVKEGAVVNVRDVAPIVGGLVFGWPVGIIAGIMGGTFRILSVRWGIAGEFTMYACAISTMLAGIFTAIYKIFMAGKKPVKWPVALMLSLLIENSHMLFVFFTRINYPEKAFAVTSACAIPMISITVLASSITLIATNIIDKIPIIKIEKPPKLASILRRIMALSLLGTFVIITATSFVLLKNDSNDKTKRTLAAACDDTESNVATNIVIKLVEYIENAGAVVNDGFDQGKSPDQMIGELLSTMKFTEINFVNKNNIITYTNIPKYLNFDMTSGSQSNEFSFLADSEDCLYIQEYLPTTMDSSVYMRYCGINVKPNAYGISYIEAGFDATSYNELVNDTIEPSAKYVRVMEKGFIAVTDFNGKVISTNIEKEEVFKKVNISQYVVDGLNSIEITDFDGVKEYYTFLLKYTDGYYILALANNNEINLDVNISFYALAFSQITLYLFLYFVALLIIKNNVSDKIAKISTALNAISDGDLNVHVDEHQSYEIDQLSNDINTTVDTLKRYAKEEAEKIEKDLRLAKQIQLSALPSTFPAFPRNYEFNLFASMNAAKEVGGDFYDFYLVDKDHLAIQIADVSGKGIPAAMFMMKAKAVIKSLVSSGMPIDKAYMEANEKLCEGNDAQMFVTALLAVIDIKTGHVELVNAGHNPPLLKHSDGKFEYLQFKAGFVLAALDGYKYTKQEFDIEPGDQLFLYTDGVTEAANKNLELFGEARLRDALNGKTGLNPSGLCQLINESLSLFARGAEQSDDITMLAFQFNGDKDAETIEVDATMENVEKATEFVENFLNRVNAPTPFIMKMNVVMDEVFSNIAKYGFPEGEPSKVRISVSINENDQFSLIFVDKGIPYDPLAKEDPDISLSAEERPIGGLGIYIIKKIMDEMLYQRDNDKNVLTLKKKLK